MQPIRKFALASWMILVFQLAACSHQPRVAQHQPVRAPAPDPARVTVIETARAMLGTPYRYGGASPRGFDCSGLVWYSHRQAGIEVPRTARRQMSAARPVGSRDLHPGDLLFFGISPSKSYHVGIYLGAGAFIHAPSSGGVVSRANLQNPYWSARLLGKGSYFRDL
jgi:cell wall-associated NlpC family hydrolase